MNIGAIVAELVRLGVAPRHDLPNGIRLIVVPGGDVVRLERIGRTITANAGDLLATLRAMPATITLDECWQQLRRQFDLSVWTGIVWTGITRETMQSKMRRRR